MAQPGPTGYYQQSQYHLYGGSQPRIQPSQQPAHKAMQQRPVTPSGHGFRSVSPAPPSNYQQNTHAQASQYAQQPQYAHQPQYAQTPQYAQAPQVGYRQQSHTPVPQQPAAGPSNAWSQISGQASPYTHRPAQNAQQQYQVPDRRQSYHNPHSPAASSNQGHDQHVQPQYTAQPIQPQYTAYAAPLPQQQQNIQHMQRQPSNPGYPVSRSISPAPPPRSHMPPSQQYRSQSMQPDQGVSGYPSRSVSPAPPSGPMTQHSSMSPSQYFPPFTPSQSNMTANSRALPAPRSRPESMPPPSRMPSNFAAPTAIAPPSRPPLLSSPSSASSMNTVASSMSNLPQHPHTKALPTSSFPNGRPPSSAGTLPSSPVPTSSFPHGQLPIGFTPSPSIPHVGLNGRPSPSFSGSQINGLPLSSFPSTPSSPAPASSFPQGMQSPNVASILSRVNSMNANASFPPVPPSPRRTDSIQRPLPAPSQTRHSQKSFSVDYGTPTRELPNPYSGSPPKPSSVLPSLPEAELSGPFIPHWKRNLMEKMAANSSTSGAPTGSTHERRGTVSDMVTAWNSPKTDTGGPTPQPLMAGSNALYRSKTSSGRPLPTSPTKTPDLSAIQAQPPAPSEIPMSPPAPSAPVSRQSYTAGSSFTRNTPQHPVTELPARRTPVMDREQASAREPESQYGILDMPPRRNPQPTSPPETDSSVMQRVTASMSGMGLRNSEAPLQSPKPSWPASLPQVSSRSSSPLKNSSPRKPFQNLDDPPPAPAPMIKRVPPSTGSLARAPSHRIPPPVAPPARTPSQRALPSAPKNGGLRQAIPKISFHGNADAYSDSSDDDGPPKINVKPEPPRIAVAAPPPPQISVSAPAPPVISINAPEPPSISVSSDASTPSFSFTIAGEEEAATPKKVAPKQLDPSQRPPAHAMACGGCGGSIIGRIVSAIGCRWHPACFQCCVCGELLEHVSSYEHELRPYCHLDYHELFAPRCYHCKTSIVDERFVTLNDEALGQRTYHEQHFFCAECGDPFLSPSRPRPVGDRGMDLTISGDGTFEDDDVGFTVYKGYAYCENCHVNLRLPKCKKCRKPIRDGARAVEALGSKWCWECFTCAGCNNPFEDPSFFEREGYPFCERCFSIIIKNDM